MSEGNPLTRLSRRITPQAEQAILGAAAEPEVSTGIGLVEEEDVVVVERGQTLVPSSKAPVIQYTKKLTADEEKKPLNVRVPKSIFEMVHRHVKLEQANGSPITKDSLVTEAIKLYFGIK
jgi:hypothetical protein